jgi:quercetin dioxygenase-like cupin family protein
MTNDVRVVALATAAVLAFGACMTPGAPDLRAQDVRGHTHAAVRADELKWGPAPPVFPPGAEMALLQGDPSVAGAIFTVRLRFPDGYILPAHFHPTDEHVTVIDGTFLVGLGDKFSKDKLLPPLKQGDFITAPANANHFATVQGKTVVQVHAIGPFKLTYVNPADTPTGAK